MMTPESPPGRRPQTARSLSAESVSLLRDAVRRSYDDPAGAEAQVREAVSSVAADARAQEMRPEELICAFKSLLDTMPETHASSSQSEESHLRARLVTLCIKAYYQR